MRYKMEIKIERVCWVYYNAKTNRYARWVVNDPDFTTSFFGDRWLDVERADLADHFSSSNPRHNSFYPPPDKRIYKLKKIKISVRTFINVENL